MRHRHIMEMRSEMKYIESLREGERINEIYLCKVKQSALTKAGKPYDNLILQDKTGTLDAKIWEPGSVGIDEFDSLDYIAVMGDITSFQGNLQLNVKRVRKVQEGEYDPKDYLPVSKKDIDGMYTELLGLIASVKHPYLRKLLESFFVEDKDFEKRFKFHSAAKSVHHGFVGGLLEHTLSVTKNCDYFAATYPILNRDLIVSAAIFHDIGKLEELSTFPENDYTDEGQLFGHIMIGAEMVGERIRTIPGSAIKPLTVYTPSFERNYTPESIVVDEPVEDGPKNANGTYLGNVTVRTAVEKSINTIAWKLYEELTPQVGLSYLENMHFSRLDAADYVPATALGGFTNGVSPLEMAAGYAALANDGMYREPTCIMRITDDTGAEVYLAAQEGQEVYRQNAARMMTDVLKGVFINGTGRGLGLSDMPCAGKTGTTNDHKDGWLVGYTRYYTTSVWVGYDMPKEMDSLMGNTYPGKIWQTFMEQAHEGLEWLDFLPYTQIPDASSGEMEAEDAATDEGNAQGETPAENGDTPQENVTDTPDTPQGSATDVPSSSQENGQGISDTPDATQEQPSDAPQQNTTGTSQENASDVSQENAAQSSGENAAQSSGENASDTPQETAPGAP